MAKSSRTSDAPMRVLVTGAAGYLGSMFLRAAAAAEQGLQLWGADLRLPATPVPGVEYLTLDVRDPGLANLLKSNRIQRVVHLASVVTPTKSMTTELMYDIDVNGTLNVLDACLSAGVDHVSISSSGAAYGYSPLNSGWLTEDQPLRGHPKFAYSIHKKRVEELLADYRARFPALGQLVFRIGTILGERTDNQITALFHKRFLIGLAGSPTPFNFIWDEDVASCFLLGMREARTGVFNLAGDGVLSLREIAELLGKNVIEVPPAALGTLLDAAARFNLTRYGPEQVDFLRYRPVLSNEQLKSTFGYRPRLNSREVFALYCRAHPEVFGPRHGLPKQHSRPGLIPG